MNTVTVVSPCYVTVQVWCYVSDFGMHIPLMRDHPSYVTASARQRGLSQRGGPLNISFSHICQWHDWHWLLITRLAVFNRPCLLESSSSVWDPQLQPSRHFLEPSPPLAFSPGHPGNSIGATAWHDATYYCFNQTFMPMDVLSLGQNSITDTDSQQQSTNMTHRWQWGMTVILWLERFLQIICSTSKRKTGGT